ncbi:hypothetical protein GBA52_008043 [Prunus armeniaca]|nr:hypothetical protein GBA52_008043 [Prunus armeniaca]
MENFQKSLEDCNLSDIDFEGFPFTWSRKNEGFEDVVKDAQEYNVDEHLSVKEKLKSYYLQSLFAKTGGHNIEVIMDMVSPKVPDQMKHFFAKPYSRDEVAYALKKMPPSKV